MSMSFNLPASVEAALRADAEAHGLALEAVVTEALAQRWATSPNPPAERETKLEFLSDEWNDRTWWESLSDDERAVEVEALRASLADADAGRVRPAADVFARMGSVKG